MINNYLKIIAFYILCLPSLSGAVTIDDIVDRCPTAQEIAEIDKYFKITAPVDASAPTIVCPRVNGSPPLTSVLRNAYLSFLASQKIKFTRPLPWTLDRYTLWDWLINDSRLKGLTTHAASKNPYSYCCEPGNIISLVDTGDINITFLGVSDGWILQDKPNRSPGGVGLVSAIGLILHEARHITHAHTCDSWDLTKEEMGAWGVQYYWYVWLAKYSDPNFLRPKNGPPRAYSDWHALTARNLELSQAFCQSKQQYPTVKVTEYFNSDLKHYFITHSVDEMKAIDSGAAGPGWSRTGQSFNAFANADTAPINTRPVCRFYGSVKPGPNSHFYTNDESECLQLIDLAGKTPPGQPKWNFENIAYYIYPALSGQPHGTKHDPQCYSNPVEPQARVIRYYNDRAALGDSNHRYFHEDFSKAWSEMILANWKLEGTVFCAPDF